MIFEYQAHVLHICFLKSVGYYVIPSIQIIAFECPLRPLIDDRNWFSLSIFGIPLPIFFKLGMRVDIVKDCSGIADG